MDAHTKMREGGWLLIGQWQGLPSPCGVPLLTEQVKEKAKDIRSYQRVGVHGMSEGRASRRKSFSSREHSVNGKHSGMTNSQSNNSFESLRGKTSIVHC